MCIYLATHGKKSLINPKRIKWKDWWDECEVWPGNTDSNSNSEQIHTQTNKNEAKQIGEVYKKPTISLHKVDEK